MSTKHQSAIKEEPQYLAKKAISLLEQKIHSEFGYYIEMGAELEFAVKDNHLITNKHNIFNLPNDDADVNAVKSSGFSPQIKRPNRQKDIFFPNSPYVAYCYKETEQNLLCSQYEVVISHEATRKAEIGGRANLTARAIDATYADILGNFPSQKTATNRHYRKATKLHHKVEAVSIEPHIVKTDIDPNKEPFLFNFEIHNGLHINISLNKAEKPNITKSELKNISNSIAKNNSELAYLLGTDQNSILRYKFRDSLYPEKITVHNDKDNNYIENTAPSASSNPYYAILVTLVGVYNGLKEMQSMGNIITKQPLISNNIENAKISFFAPDNSARKLLNEIDDNEHNLGNRLWQAIEKTPPSEELRLFQKQGRFDLHKNHSLNR